MDSDELIAFGAHTHTHRGFRSGVNEFQRDLQTSVDIVRATFDGPDVMFAFPFGRTSLGHVTPEMTEAARTVGVSCGLTTDNEQVDITTDPFGWGRFNAYDFDCGATLAGKLGGWYGWAPRIQERLSRAGTVTERRGLGAVQPR